MGHRRESCEAQFTWSAVVVGAGDIARCDGSGGGATARLLDGISGTVFTVGDNVCSSGKAREVADCYGPSWERPKGRTKPSVGNHEYLTSGVSGYFAYFGSAAGPRARATTPTTAATGTWSCSTATVPRSGGAGLPRLWSPG